MFPLFPFQRKGNFVKFQSYSPPMLLIVSQLGERFRWNIHFLLLIKLLTVRLVYRFHLVLSRVCFVYFTTLSEEMGGVSIR